MKNIDKMNLAECISVVRRLTPDELERDVQWRVSARIEKLTSWVSVSKQLPTEDDAKDKEGWFFVITHNGADCGVCHMDDFKSTRVSHWKRIDKPEGV